MDDEAHVAYRRAGSRRARLARKVPSCAASTACQAVHSPTERPPAAAPRFSSRDLAAGRRGRALRAGEPRYQPPRRRDRHLHQRRRPHPRRWRADARNQSRIGRSPAMHEPRDARPRRKDPEPQAVRRGRPNLGRTSPRTGALKQRLGKRPSREIAPVEASTLRRRPGQRPIATAPTPLNHAPHVMRESACATRIWIGASSERSGGRAAQPNRDGFPFRPAFSARRRNRRQKAGWAVCAETCIARQATCACAGRDRSGRAAACGAPPR